MKVLKEKVLSVRGGWVIKGRIVLYHGDRVRREELFFDRDMKMPGFQEVGFTFEDMHVLQQLLADWLKTNP
jgi:hypothetical protein